MREFNRVTILSKAPLTSFAAERFCIELNNRIPGIASAAVNEEEAAIVFETRPGLSADEFAVEERDGRLYFVSEGIRGAMYAAGLFLKKAVKTGESLSLTKDITGAYSPSKRIRGHQLGYRTTPNTYDAWSFDDYERYYIELMFAGVNTVEHIPYENGYSKRNPLMKYDEEEFLVKAVEMADSLDLDVSLWHPNAEGETDETAAERRKNLYKKLCRVNYVFVPGGDPGSLPAREFVKRCRAISSALKEVHPSAELWPSAQAPHEYPCWGKEFLDELNIDAKGIDGIIYGPNHAMPLEELYEFCRGRFEMRFYPDITHNVRCEYPVHYDKNDWHYALCTCLGRECTNPRPEEYYGLYKETEDFFEGSVSYSEGITDDVNKFLWSSLDYDGGITAREAIEDYSRLFFFGADFEKTTDLIFGLEENWRGDPASNESIDRVYSGFCEILKNHPFLAENWRFLQLYFRACCDMLVKQRFVFETELILRARAALESGDSPAAYDILRAEYPPCYNTLRKEIDYLAERLFSLIGYQSDVEHYYADNPERGAVLDTIDLPVTDRKLLLSKYDECETPSQWLEYFARNDVSRDEYHFSVALDNVKEKQTGEPYFNFKGDRVGVNDGTLPAALFNVFDNFEYRSEISGLSDGEEYTLRVTYLDKKDGNVTSHKICVNGEVIYCGAQFGDIDEEYTRRFCRPGFVCAAYLIPPGIIKGGKVLLEMSEPLMGVMFAEYSFRKNKQEK